MRRLLAPEVIQTSGTDCGPACLKSLLDGFGLPVSYDGLRDACHTDVDGTSIDMLEELAKDLGLDAEQVIVPGDHALLGESAALPAIAVVRNPDDTVHFVVAWRRCGPFVQVMDPALGRVWMPIQRYLDRLIVHVTVAPTAEWREWAGTDAFLRPLASRLRAAGLTAQQTRERIVAAAADPGYLGLATLDAAARMLTSLRAANAVSRKDAAGVLGGLVSTADDSDAVSQIPEHYWSVRPASAPADHSEHLRVRGVVLVAIRGRRPQEHRAALTIAGSARPHPLREVLSILHASGPLAAVILAIALLVVTAGVVFEAVLFRGLLDAASLLRIPEQGLSAGALLVTFAGSLLGIELLLAALERRAGRQVDARLRLAFLQRIPRLSPSYFQSRPVSDTIERSHSLQTVRQLPTLGIRALRVSLELAVTTAALAWLNPQVAVIAVLSAAAAAAIPLLGQPIIAERDLRVRTHVGALARFHLDAILGRKAIDAHGTAAVIERQHDSLLLDWATASLALQRASVTIEGLQMIVGVALAGWMVAFHTAGDASGLVLLQLYWMLNVPALGYELALHAREYPQHRSTLYRLLEPLQAPGARTFDEQLVSEADAGRPSGLQIDIQQVTVRASGNTLLANVDLSIAAGTHVAVVGASGAGKSTLIGLLLGWHQAEAGEVLTDGLPIQTMIARVRQGTAWVDSSVYIWNKSLLENLQYGSKDPRALGPVLEQAGLVSVLAKLPEGLNSVLGENGAVLSAGEAQRVRLARAMLRPSTRLALLDEPFVGLEGERRRALLGHVRRHWQGSTLLYVTHDVAEARQFDRVLVMDQGRLVEDGSPQTLASNPTSRYRRLLQAQERANDQLTSAAGWRRIRLASGRIVNDQVHAFEHTA